MTNSLTPFGLELAKATRENIKNFDTAVKSRQDAYHKNIVRIQQLRNVIKNNPRVLIAGAGNITDIDNIENSTKSLLRSGVNWTSFNPDLDVQIQCGTHALPLEATLYSARPPELIIHGVYSKVPPCISRSFTIQWSDPFMSREYGGAPSAYDLEMAILKKAVGPAPYIPSVKNVVFLNSMVMIWLGAKKLFLTGIDPLQPEYFFTGKPDLCLTIIKAITQANPWIAEWDGRNERISERQRNTQHRRMSAIADLLSESGSGVGTPERIKVMEQGFRLLVKFCEIKDVKISYLGESKFLEKIGLHRAA